MCAQYDTRHEPRATSHEPRATSKCSVIPWEINIVAQVNWGWLSKIPQVRRILTATKYSKSSGYDVGSPGYPYSVDFGKARGQPNP